MACIKLTLNEDYYKRLSKMAQDEKMSIQEYIRNKIFQEETIFTPEEAIKRAHKKFSPGIEFSLPDIYDNDWTLERGMAGVFGKRFFNYVDGDGTTGIEFVDMGKYGRRAMYRIKTNY